MEIKLKEIMDAHDINISELSDETGLSRSTLTPLIKEPNNIGGLKLETIKLLCDFFGIKINRLIEITPSKPKYFLEKIYTNDSNVNEMKIVLTKRIAMKERRSLVSISFDSFSVSNYPEGSLAINIKCSFMSKKEAKVFSETTTDFPKLTTFSETNIFEQDIRTQTSKNILAQSKIIAKIVSEKSDPSSLITMDIDCFNVSWDFSDKQNKNIVTCLLEKTENGFIEIEY